MAALLHWTPMILHHAHMNGLTVSMRPRNLLQTLELRNASSRASQLKAFRRFNGKRAAPSSSASSSVILATSNIHADGLQTIHDTHMVDNTSNRLGIGHTQTDHNMKEVQQRQQAALDFVVPDFIPLVPFKMNPGLEEANKKALKWAVHNFESFMSPENFQNLFYQENTHYAAGGAYPDAPISRFDFAIEFIAWLYVLDDQSLLSQKSSLEELVQTQLDIQVVIMAAYPQDKSLQDNLVKCVSDELGHFEFAKDFVEKVVAQATTKHLLGSEYDEHISPIASAFQDLWIRAISLMPKEWSLRFGKLMQRDVFANFLESHNLHHDTCPSVSAYILERRKSGFVHPSLVIQELLQDVFLPDSIYHSLPMQRLLYATIDVVCWENDIWSFPKEVVAGEMANLVFLISKEEGCSYNKAAKIVTEMMVDKCKEMQHATIELKEYCKIHELTTTQKAAIECYISCCNHWVSGSHTFHSQSSRFQVVRA
ncbi:unnamed protein product [Sphagnum jensenii]|uniref:Terpene synthase n=1 Tax=Sphagnum jensenii TaxID=128206 RepID=A0ABP1AMH9_9BRYO